MGIFRHFGTLTGIRRRTLSSAWSLLRSGDLLSIARRSARRLIALRPTPRITHAEWRRCHADLTEANRAWILAHPAATHLAVVVAAGDGTDETVASLERQLHDGWSIGPRPDHWTVELEAGIVLHEAALWVLATAIDDTDSNGPNLRLVYSDHDHLDKDGQPVDPAFLPDWNPELFAGLGQISPLVARHPDLSQAFPRVPVPTDLHPSQVRHLPYLLASQPITDSWMALPISPPRKQKSATPPRVSILIPTRDQGQLLDTCLRSIRERSTHPDVELVVVDHDTTEPYARRILDALTNDAAATVLQHRGPFNFAAMMNRAADKASGEHLVLLNNDTEVLSPDWLELMTAHLDRPDVGIVGALLLFPDGTIQHAGVHPGLGGLMGHGHKHLPGDDPGHLGRLQITHRVAAVTGACMAIRADQWCDLGGLDEGLTVAYNDIDLCLKARSAGKAVLLEPKAVLRHHESVSRGYDDDPARRTRLQGEINRMRDRWGDHLDEDPAYNPNLSLAEPGFTPADPPRVSRPWGG